MIYADAKESQVLAAALCCVGPQYSIIIRPCCKFYALARQGQCNRYGVIFFKARVPIQPKVLERVFGRVLWEISLCNVFHGVSQKFLILSLRRCKWPMQRILPP